MSLHFTHGAHSLIKVWGRRRRLFLFLLFLYTIFFTINLFLKIIRIVVINVMQASQIVRFDKIVDQLLILVYVASFLLEVFRQAFFAVDFQVETYFYSRRHDKRSFDFEHRYPIFLIKLNRLNPTVQIRPELDLFVNKIIIVEVFSIADELFFIKFCLDQIPSPVVFRRISNSFPQTHLLVVFLSSGSLRFDFNDYGLLVLKNPVCNPLLRHEDVMRPLTHHFCYNILIRGVFESMGSNILKDCCISQPFEGVVRSADCEFLLDISNHNDNGIYT
mmetsp:Transcript_12898/g.23422  ORF Transcript_12898/g.23422 Transcript_12898/m.23422 type:complete len:275 (-) Transcript_12898:377-1201(-)